MLPHRHAILALLVVGLLGAGWAGVSASFPGENQDLEHPSEVMSNIDVNGNGLVATDPDGDGLYEDVNGDGTADCTDPEVLRDHLNDPAVRTNLAFDFNEDGTVNMADYQALRIELDCLGPQTPTPTPTPPFTSHVVEEVVSKDLQFATAVSNLTVLQLPNQTIIVKEVSCLVQQSDAWHAHEEAMLGISVGDTSVSVRCRGRTPSFNSVSPMVEVPPGATVNVTTNDGGVYEIDLWLKIAVGNESTTVTS